MNELSKKHNKKLLCFVMEDHHIPYNIESNVILFKPDIIRSFKLENERSFPMIRNDFFKNILKNPKLSIGFIGNNNNNREKYLTFLEKSRIETHFIRRNGWWGGSGRSNMHRVHHDYYNNMNDNLFSFCARGGGNYSYRFYEILMMGRIPIFINTECVIPFEEEVDIREIALVIDEKELTEDKEFHCKGSGRNVDLVYDKKLDYIDKIIPLIEDYYNTNKDRLEEIQNNNRKIWKKYYSAVGFVSTILEKY